MATATRTPKAARTVSNKRVYTINGQSLWSVTTIIKSGFPAPAIAGWQARTIAEYAVANWRQIGAMLETVRLQRSPDGAAYPYVVTDPDAVKAAVEWLKGSPWRESERKRDLGSAVHREAEAVQLGTPRPEPSLTVAPYVASFRHFLDDFQPEIEMTEATVYSVTESYAGTLDAIMSIGGRRLLVDFKTGMDVYADVALQLSAYAHAERVLLDDGSSHEMPSVDGALALLLHPYDPATPDIRGYLPVPVAYDYRDPVSGRDLVWDAFRNGREVMRWMEDTSTRVLSQPVMTPEALAFLYPQPIQTEGTAA